MLAGLITAVCACAFACAALDPEPESTPVPTPTPTPAAVIAVAGGEDETAFRQMIELIASSAACEFVSLDESALAGWRPKGRASLILYLEQDKADTDMLFALEARGIGVYAYAARGQALPEELPSLRYEGKGAAAKALEAALQYDGYDTPVRLIGLFTGADSEAAALWSKAVSEGRVLVKGSYYEAGAKKDAADWLASQLGGLYEGMLDGVFCETAALATAAMEALLARERKDIELFSAELNGALIVQLEKISALKYAAGADPALAGRLCAEQAIVLLYGGTAQALSISPSLFPASPPAP